MASAAGVRFRNSGDTGDDRSTLQENCHARLERPHHEPLEPHESQLAQPDW